MAVNHVLQQSQVSQSQVSQGQVQQGQQVRDALTSPYIQRLFKVKAY